MKLWEYYAIDHGNTIHKGTMLAVSLVEANRHLIENGLTPLEITESQNTRLTTKIQRIKSYLRRLTSDTTDENTTFSD